MELFILGSGTAIPSAHRSSPGAALKIGEEIILLDCGSGSLHKLAGLGQNFLNIYYILISHLHPDHIIDLVPLLFALRSPNLPPVDQAITIVGGKGIKHYFNKVKELYNPWADAPRNINLIEAGKEEFHFPYFSLKTAPVEHTLNSIAFRISTADGKSFFYSGDSGYCSPLIELARDADVALIECSFPEKMKVEGHLTPKLAGKIATEAGCNKIILTHFYPQCDNYDIKALCEEKYSGEVIIAEDGMHINI